VQLQLLKNIKRYTCKAFVAVKCSRIIHKFSGEWGLSTAWHLFHFKQPMSLHCWLFHARYYYDWRPAISTANRGQPNNYQQTILDRRITAMILKHMLLDVKHYQKKRKDNYLNGHIHQVMVW